ncbi:MAG: hypothetical protein ABIP03_02980 [Aquihabitans sp.]
MADLREVDPQMSDRCSDGSGPASSVQGRCPGRNRTPVVLVAVRHPQLRRWTTELLESACGCWGTVRNLDHELLADAITRIRPDVVALDSLDFPACCHEALATLEPQQVVVIGPEPDSAYRRSALDLGAGGWVSQDHIGEELVSAVWTALGCDCQPCPMQPLMTIPTGTTPRPTGDLA